MINFAPKTRNFYNKMIYDDCSEPWTVYVETVVPAFIKLFLTITLLQYDDIIRSIGDDLSNDPVKGRRRRGGHFRKPRVPEADFQWGRISQGGLKTVMWLTEPIEKIGFVWLLYSAADQFFYDWQTLIRHRGFCDASPELRPLQRETDGSSSLLTPTGGPLPLQKLTRTSPAFGSNAFGAGMIAGKYQAHFSANIDRETTPYSNVSIGLVVTTSSGTKVFRSSESDVSVDSPTGFVVSAEWYNPDDSGRVSWEVFGPASAVGVRVTNARIFVRRQPGL